MNCDGKQDLFENKHKQNSKINKVKNSGAVGLYLSVTWVTALGGKKDYLGPER